MNPNYSYLRFGTMPYQTPDNPVSPYRPLSLGKKMYRVLFEETTFTIIPGGELECILMEGYLYGVDSEPIALFCTTHTNLSSPSPERVPANKQILTGKPGIADHATCYIGGYMSFSHSSGTGPVELRSKYYEPNHTTTYMTWDGTITAPAKTLTITGTGAFISCMPSEIKSKRFYQLNIPDFHTMTYHTKVRNSGTGNVDVKVSGMWWLETYEALGTSPVTFTDDKCPYKLAEFVFGELRNTKRCILRNAALSEYSNLDTTITNALATIVNPWQILTSGVNVSVTVIGEVPPVPEPEPDSDEEWGSRPVLWNP